jgi:hypothetical protein
MSGPDFFSESIMLKRISRHVLMLTGAIGVSIVGYNTAVCLGGFGGGTVQAGTSGSVAFSADYQLSELRLFDRTRYFVRERYVEPGRIQPEAMFDAALDAVEREVDSVLLVREPGGRLLHVSVGAYTTTLMVEDISSMDDLRSALGDVAAVLEERLDPEQVDLPAVEYALCNGMLSTLDPHSVLMPPDLSADMNTENQGEFGGLGITITTRKGRLTVEYPLEDTPAYRAGLKAGDHIVRIEEESTINMTLDEAVSKLRGPVGEPVTIMIRRDMWDEDRPFTIVRDTIRINPRGLPAHQELPCSDLPGHGRGPGGLQARAGQGPRGAGHRPAGQRGWLPDPGHRGLGSIRGQRCDRLDARVRRPP